MNKDDLLVPTILTSEMIEKMIYVVRGNCNESNLMALGHILGIYFFLIN